MKKFGVERFVQDYRVVEYTNKKGKIRRKAEYIGQWYVAGISETKQRRVHILFAVASLVIFACLFGALVLDYAADGELYVVLPCAVALFPALYMIMSIFSQPKIGAKMERIQYEHAYLRVGRSSMAILILVGVGLIGTVVYDILCINHTIDKQLTVYDVLFLGLTAVVIALSIVLFLTVRGVNISIEENTENPDEIRKNS